MAKIDQPMLNKIIEGRVFFVEDQINAKLETKANIYSHHHCLPSNSPGKIIQSFVIKAKNSTVLGLFQYALSDMFFMASTHSKCLFNTYSF
jgi:hypothetical protein